MCITYYKIDNGTMTIFYFPVFFFSLFHLLCFELKLFETTYTSRLGYKFESCRQNNIVIVILRYSTCIYMADLLHSVWKIIIRNRCFGLPCAVVVVVPDEYLPLTV